jgi:hypothetical protein
VTVWPIPGPWGAGSRSWPGEPDPPGGTLASEALERIRGRLETGTALAVLPISVAALMTADWLDRHLPDAGGCDRVLVPGLLRGDLAPLERRLGVPVERGPRDLKDLPRFLGGEPEPEDSGTTGPGSWRS